MKAMLMKKKATPLEPWCLYPEGQQIHDQAQPLPVLPISSPTYETSEQRYRRLKAIADATGERLLFVYLRDQGRATIGDRPIRKRRAPLI